MQALVVTTDGFEDSEFSYPYYRLQEAGVDVDVATPDGESVTGKHDYEFDADAAIDDRQAGEWAEAYDLLVVPGGRAPEQLRSEAPEAADVVAAFVDADRPVASICHGVQLLISADVIEGCEVTGYGTLEVDVENAGATYRDEAVVVDEPFVTSRVPDDLPAFMAETLSQLDVDAESAAAATPA